MRKETIPIGFDQNELSRPTRRGTRAQITVKLVAELITIVAVFAAVTPVALADERQFVGDFAYRCPSGWRTEHNGEATLLIAPIRGEQYLMLLPPENAPANSQAMFQDRWRKLLQGYRVLQSQPPAWQRLPSGLDALVANALGADQRGIQRILQMVMLRTGGRAETVFFTSDRAAYSESVRTTIAAFFQGVSFGAPVEPPQSVAPPSQSGGAGSESNRPPTPDGRTTAQSDTAPVQTYGATAQSDAPLASAAGDAASSGFGLEGRLRTIGGVGYVAPKGWSVKESGGAVVMTGPVPQQYQPCLLVLDPTVRPAGDMATRLEAIVDGNFGRQFGPYHGETGADLKAGQYQGISVAGWPYVDLLGQLGKSNFHVRALLAHFNDRAVAVMGLFNSVDCLGSYYVRDNDTFLTLFHSLRLPGFDGASPQLAKQLLGSWQSVGSNVGVRVTYAANGQFDDGAVKANYYVSDSGLIYDLASHFVGNGTYRVDGDRLTMTGHGATRTMLFSVVRRPRADRPGEYDEILRRVEPTDNQVWGFARTGYYVISYNRTH